MPSPKERTILTSVADNPTMVVGAALCNLKTSAKTSPFSNALLKRSLSGEHYISSCSPPIPLAYRLKNHTVNHFIRNADLNCSPPIRR